MEQKDDNPNLSDVLNAIITGVSRGRQSSDIEALKIALEYNKIDLLKGLPAPRMRINNIQVNLPILIGQSTIGNVAIVASIDAIVQSAQEGMLIATENSLQGVENSLKIVGFQGDVNNHHALELQEFQNFFTEVKSIFTDVKGMSKESKVVFGEDLRFRLENGLTNYKLTTDGHLSSAGIKEVVSDVVNGNLRDTFKAVIFNSLKGKSQGGTFDVDTARRKTDDYIKNQLIADCISRVRYAVLEMCVEKDDMPPQQKVEVETDAIKNKGGDPSLVTRVSFVLREEGLEWTKPMEGDENSPSTLSIE